ncbi:GntR family transcriptional regulator [Prolixibacter bellariivorans]|uniref:GntR family transcriptional regulator n=1 Tax=Prolixibacter bellariivorans TaxID=314319 RepID=A0A5M4AUL8_9BACT|nr:S1-like domain-containing RNA-binding protein [Prolixibacter bellariivorans]GET31231.1 GntR family transcriptional regulator [Prolixibacter bellariivorans]
MNKLGTFQALEVMRLVDFGAYLDGQELGDILLPKRYMPEGCKPGDFLEVFIYLDSEDRIIATTEEPLATAGDFALLKVVSVNQIGAFLDWGLPKDLLVPFSEQKSKMEEGHWYIVYVYVDDESRRMVATTKLDKYLDNVPPEYHAGQEVQLMIHSKTDIGYKAIVNNMHWGMLYQNEVFRPLKSGEQLPGYIKQVREDEKLDVSLQKPGIESAMDLSDRILNMLKEQGGFLAVTDKSSPETIYSFFGESKKNYKRAVGMLYKKRIITIEPDGIRLNQ